MAKEEGALATAAVRAPAPMLPALMGTPLHSKSMPEMEFDEKGWKRFKALKNAAPIYTAVKSKDNKHYFAPRFKEGEELLLPDNDQTAKYVDLKYLER